MELTISLIDVVLQLVTTFPQASDVRPLIGPMFWIPHPFHSKVLSTISFEIPFNEVVDLLSTVLVFPSPVTDIDGLSQVQVEVQVYGLSSWALNSKDINSWHVRHLRGILVRYPLFIYQLVAIFTRHLFIIKGRV